MPNEENKITVEQLRSVVKVLKEANLHAVFLDDKSREFILSVSSRYRNFGKHMRLSPKQLKFVESIGTKLFVWEEGSGGV